MKRTILLFLILSLGLISCTFVEKPPPIDDVATVCVISAAGYIYRPLITGSDDWSVQPGNLETLDFSSGCDQYGNLVGLLDDERWAIQKLHVKLDQKGQEETLFRPTNLGPHEYVWFPGHTAKIEPISGRPLPMYPLEGYPWDPCLPNTIPEMTSQMATVLASAHANWIEVEITAPKRSGGEYTLDLPGYTPTASNVLTVRLGFPQAITVLWTKGDVIKVWEVDIRVDWFWINGEWRIPVGPTGVCVVGCRICV